MNFSESGYFFLCLILIVSVGILQSWNVALGIVNFALVSAILSLGLNIQWGYSGLFNVGIVGFVALGGLAVVVISAPPVHEAWSVGAIGVLSALSLGLITIIGSLTLWKRMKPGKVRFLYLIIFLAVGLTIFRAVFDPAVEAIEKINPAITGNLGGLNLPVLIAWPVGGLLAGVVAFVIGKIALGLRADYLAIATLAISEVIVAILKHEEWLTRGVKNISGLPRPVPYEINLQQSQWFIETVENLGLSLIEASSMTVKLCYSALLLMVLALVFTLCQKALNSPWGRMMRAIRENEHAAAAMGKNIKKRHLQVFVLGSMVCGMAGAIITTLDGQFTPGSYQPLRFTFLVWIMVIVGGSGNNWGAVLGGLLVWFFWIQVEPMGIAAVQLVINLFDPSEAMRQHLIAASAYMRLLLMGIFLLIVMRFRPKGLIPER